MSTVPRTEPAVPLADVLALLGAVDTALDSPKDGAPDALRYRLSYLSGALSTVEDARGVRHATAALLQLADDTEGGAQ